MIKYKDPSEYKTLDKDIRLPRDEENVIVESQDKTPTEPNKKPKEV